MILLLISIIYMLFWILCGIHTCWQGCYNMHIHINPRYKFVAKMERAFPILLYSRNIFGKGMREFWLRGFSVTRYMSKELAKFCDLPWIYWWEMKIKPMYLDKVKSPLGVSSHEIAVFFLKNINNTKFSLFITDDRVVTWELSAFMIRDLLYERI